MSITHLENLSNEIFYEIFDYLNGYKLYQAFSNLNSQFEQLLHSSYVLFKTHFCLLKYDEVMNIFKQFIYPNRHQVYSIYVNFGQPKIIQSDTLIPILRNLSSLPRLFSLTIETSNVKEEINDIYRLTFILSKLKYYRILSFNNHYPITLRTAMDNQFCPIEYLIIDIIVL